MPNTAMRAFAKNVARLMAERGWTQSVLSAKSGVGQTTLSALLRYSAGVEKVSTLDTVAALAKAFGVEPWLLQIPNISIDVLVNGKVEELIDVYVDVGAAGRENIHRVAESEARYESLRRETKKAG